MKLNQYTKHTRNNQQSFTKTSNSIAMGAKPHRRACFTYSFTAAFAKVTGVSQLMSLVLKYRNMPTY